MNTPLDEDRIRASLSEAARRQLDSIDVLDIVSSTNTWLMQQQKPDVGRFRVAVAEQQTAGRGRHGKRWASPRGRGLYLSIAYTFSKKPDKLACLTLAAGIASLQSLKYVGARQITLKWPNDIYACESKMGGILTDAQSGRGGHISVACGIGINLDLSSIDRERDGLVALDYQITDLKSHCDVLPERCALVAEITGRVMSAISVFEKSGLAPFRADWNKYDWLNGKQVDVDMPGAEFVGTANGIDDNGALRVITARGTRSVYTGTVRLRKASGE